MGVNLLTKYNPPRPPPSQAQPAYHSLPRREPNGRHQRPSAEEVDNTDHGVRNRWKRLRDNRKEMLLMGGRADWATVLGRLMGGQELSEAEYKAGQRYAELAGRYHRLHPPTTPLHAVSPSYQRGFGRDEEVDRHLKNGTINDYERKARKIRDKWNEVQKKLFSDQPRNLSRTNPVREALDDLTIYDKEIPSVMVERVKERLGYLARYWGMK